MALRVIWQYMDGPSPKKYYMDRSFWGPYNIFLVTDRSYGSIWTGPSPKQYYMDRSFWGPYNIFLVTDRFIYCHMTLSAMNYLLYNKNVGINFSAHDAFLE